MTPDLYSLVTAAQQVFGDQFALHVAETAREYLDAGPAPFARMQMGINQARLPDGEIVSMKNRLPGQAVVWRRCELRPRPPRPDQLKWRMQWNPYSQCSWPPEDVAIERFRTHVKDAALALLGNDLARTEKFTTSLKDGLDLRETLRNWHTGELYVKILARARKPRLRDHALRRAGRPARLSLADHLARRKPRRVDSVVLCHRFREGDDRPGDCAGDLRRGDVPLPAAAHTRRLA